MKFILFSKVFLQIKFEQKHFRIVTQRVCVGESMRQLLCKWIIVYCICF